MKNKLVKMVLGITVFLIGLYGGVGFFTAIGGNPAIKLMSDKTFAEFWQHIDYYMGARMPVFGPILLVALLTSIITLLSEWRTLSFWLIIMDFVLIVTDVVFTLSTNHPLSQLI